MEIFNQEEYSKYFSKKKKKARRRRKKVKRKEKSKKKRIKKSRNYNVDEGLKKEWKFNEIIEMKKKFGKEVIKETKDEEI